MISSGVQEMHHEADIRDICTHCNKLRVYFNLKKNSHVLTYVSIENSQETSKANIVMLTCIKDEQNILCTQSKTTNTDFQNCIKSLAYSILLAHAALIVILLV